MKILVTGATGFLGKYLCERLKKDRHELILVSQKGNQEDLNEERITHLKLDLTNNEELSVLPEDVNCIINLAGKIPLDTSLESEKECFNVNVLATLNLLNYARRINLKKFIQASTLAVYGNQNSNVKEDAPKKPLHSYGISKLAAEQLCLQYESEGRKMVILRFAHLYGHGQSPKGVIPFFISKAMNKEPITVHGEGNNVMDFIYVKDAVSATMLALYKDMWNRGISKGIYNIGSLKPTNLREISKEVNEIFANNQSQIIFDTEKEERDPYGVWGFNMDSSRAKQDLGYVAHYNLEYGFRSFKEIKEENQSG